MGCHMMCPVHGCGAGFFFFLSFFLSLCSKVLFLFLISAGIDYHLCPFSSSSSSSSLLLVVVCSLCSPLSQDGVRDESEPKRQRGVKTKDPDRIGSNLPYPSFVLCCVCVSEWMRWRVGMSFYVVIQATAFFFSSSSSLRLFGMGKPIFVVRYCGVVHLGIFFFFKAQFVFVML